MTEHQNGSMYYSPHSLYKKVESEVRDEHNRIVSANEKWEYVCPCRCDDNTTQKFEDENGREYIPKYKIVCDRADVSVGDYVQCRIDESCGNAEIRGEGRVLNAPKCNYLDYMVLYV